MSEPTGRPAGRYGGPGRAGRRRVTLVVVLLATAFGAWVVWAALGAAPDTKGALVAFKVVDERSVRVRVEVVADRAVPVVCRVQAEDRGGEVVGLATVTVPPGPRDRRETEVRLTTRDRAVTAGVTGCRAAGEG